MYSLSNNGTANENFLENYYKLAQPLQSLYYMLFAICTVSVFDRFVFKFFLLKIAFKIFQVTPRINKRRTFHKMNQTLSPKPNVELFMRRTELIELTSWKVRRLAQLSSSEWVWIVQHVLSVCSRRIERLKIVSGTNVDFHMRRTKLIIKTVYNNVYLASFGRKFLTDLIELIGSTCHF